MSFQKENGALTSPASLSHRVEENKRNSITENLWREPYTCEEVLRVCMKYREALDASERSLVDVLEGVKCNEDREKGFEKHRPVLRLLVHKCRIYAGGAA